MNITRTTPKLLKRLQATGTLEGGKAGCGPQTIEPQVLPPVSSAEKPSSALVVELDNALSAVCGMFAAALRPDATGARYRLDAHYETLITAVEAFRNEVPKA